MPTTAPTGTVTQAQPSGNAHSFRQRYTTNPLATAPKNAKMRRSQILLTIISARATAPTPERPKAIAKDVMANPPLG